MRTVSRYASAILTAAMLAPGIGAYAQDSKLSVPNVEVTAPPFVGTRSPYFGRYRVEEDKFGVAPCSQNGSNAPNPAPLRASPRCASLRWPSVRSRCNCCAWRSSRPGCR